MYISANNVDITPTERLELSGYSGRSGAYTAVHSNLEANFIVWPSSLGLTIVVTIDALFPSRRLRKDLLSKLNALGASNPDAHTIEDVVIVSSHTHYAPSLDPTKVLGAFDETHYSSVVARLVGAINRSISQRHAVAEYQFGQARCDRNVYRRKKWLIFSKKKRRFVFGTFMAPNHDKEVDRVLKLILARDQQGKPLFAIWSWPCHAVNCPDIKALSSDFPGRVRDRIRDMLDDEDLPVLYFPGFCGDIRANARTQIKLHPRFLLLRPLLRTFAPIDEREFSELCNSIGDAVEQALTTMTSDIARGKLALGQSSIQLDEMIDSSGEPVTPMNHEDFDVRCVQFDDFRVIFLSAEVCDPYRHLLKEFADEKTIMTGYYGHVFGYLPSDEQVAEGGYESEGFFAPFTLAGKFKRNIEDRVRRVVGEAVSDCLARLSAERSSQD